MRSKYSDSRRCAAAFIRFAMDRFDHNHRGGAIACWNYFINDRKVSGFWTPKDDAVVLTAPLERSSPPSGIGAARTQRAARLRRAESIWSIASSATPGLGSSKA